ncbi:hypothetical protein BKA69DRAFT_1120775 [Paraphysoderma sedebokerense]|nr:hypothetical protein BKA69DRAFT_1120775 [Paraphysoderma sedebokerense]
MRLYSFLVIGLLSASVHAQNLPSHICRHNAGSAVLESPFARDPMKPVSDIVVGTAGNNVIPRKDCNVLVYNDKFLEILGFNDATKNDQSVGKVEVVLEREYQFAHEAPVFIPAANTFYFSSNRLQHQNGSQYATFSSLDLKNRNLKNITSVSNAIPIVNGATNDPKDPSKIIIVNIGNPTHPGGVWSYNTKTEEIKPLVNNIEGIPFNSPNDVVVSLDGSSIFFTDPSYGSEQKLRPAPQLGDFVFKFDVGSGQVQVVLDGFVKPNGLVFSPDEKTLYVTDSGYIRGDGQTFPKQPRAVYAFDVDKSNGWKFSNRRLFAVADVGIPDGIKVDKNGNVYVGTGEGVVVYNQNGTLLGKILTVYANGKKGDGAANMAFVNNELYMLCETRIVKIKLGGL